MNEGFGGKFDGIVFKNDEVESLKAHCDLWRDATIDTDNVTYAWGIKDSAVCANTTLSAAATSGATTVTVASVANMEADGKITIGSAQYTISSVNTSTRVVTLTSALSAAVSSGATVSCPYYNSMLGAGWACLSSTNQRGATAGGTTTRLPSPTMRYSTSRPSSVPSRIQTPRRVMPRPIRLCATLSRLPICQILLSWTW